MAKIEFIEYEHEELIKEQTYTWREVKFILEFFMLIAFILTIFILKIASFFTNEIKIPTELVFIYILLSIGYILWEYLIYIYSKI